MQAAAQDRIFGLMRDDSALQELLNGDGTNAGCRVFYVEPQEDVTADEDNPAFIVFSDDGEDREVGASNALVDEVVIEIEAICWRTGLVDGIQIRLEALFPELFHFTVGDWFVGRQIAESIGGPSRDEETGSWIVARRVTWSRIFSTA